MRLIHHARKIFSCGLLLISLGAKCQAPSKSEQTLDLTLAPTSERRSLGVPGSFGGGTSDGRSLGPEQYDLPLKAKIEKTELRQGPSGDVLRLRVEVLNTGATPFQLPSCVDELKAHGANQIDRRTFEFRFEFSGQHLEIPIRTTADVTFNASSTPQCSIPIPPGARIHIVLETAVTGAARASGTVSSQTKVSALFDELTLDNNRFQVIKQSREIRSEPVPFDSSTLR
jgi:hypothetical protein